MKKGAPIQPLLTEGAGEVGGVASILKGTSPQCGFALGTLDNQ